MKTTIVIFFLSVDFFFCSCGNQFYYPKSQEPVLLSHASQLKINTISTASSLNGLTAFSIAYSPKEKFGLQAGISTGGGTSGKESTATGMQTVTRREYFAIPYISAGYYRLIDKEFLFEVYGGIGLYNYKNKAAAFVNKLGHYNLYLQPTIAYLNKNVEVAFTARVDYLNRYNAVVTSGLAPANIDSSDYKFLNYKNYLFFQPGITFKAGVKKFKAQIQLSHSYPLSSKYKSIYGTHGNYNLIKAGIGFTFDLDIKKKNKSIK